MNIDMVKMKNINHQEPMEKERPDSYLSDKEKFLKKHKNLIDREVMKNESRRKT